MVIVNHTKLGVLGNKKISLVDFIEACCTKLGVNTPELSVTVVNLPKALVSGDYTIVAVCQQLVMPHSYLVYLTPDTPWARLLSIVAHELIHLSQYERGDLKADGTKIYWRGKLLSPPYDESAPHEAEAFKGMNKLYRAIIKELTNKRNKA